MRRILLLVVALMLVACSDVQEKYLGYWEEADDSSPAILKIWKEGENTYLYDRNIMREVDSWGNKKNGSLLEKTKEGLGVSGMGGITAFNLSDDGNTLRIRNKKYIKISEDKALKAVSDHKMAVEARNQNIQLCKDLSNKYYAELKKYTSVFTQDAVDQIKTITEQYKELQKEIPDCQLLLIP